MPTDLTPEEIDAQSTSASLDLDEVLETQDIGAQPGPEDFDEIDEGAPRPAASLSKVNWPTKDNEAPDYAYLANEADPTTFSLTADVIETLVELNRYEPYRSKNIIAFALRGAQLKHGHEVELADAIDLLNVRPDHRNFRCVIGFYFTDTKKLTAYTGSTVPCRRAIWSYKNGGSASNMLPTGLHTFYVWRHKKIWPALRLGFSAADPETGAKATVLRNKNNYSIETRDIFDLSTPYDNVHCSYHTTESSYLGARFSSWGCLTVRGKKTPSDQWKKFQATLTSLGKRSRVDLLLATGKDAALVDARMHDTATLAPMMEALRRGSRGAEVERLQSKIGVTPSGFFGAETLDAFTAQQRKMNLDAGVGPIADGIYSHPMDHVTGWNIFASGQVSV